MTKNTTTSPTPFIIRADDSVEDRKTGRYCGFVAKTDRPHQEIRDELNPDGHPAMVSIAWIIVDQGWEAVTPRDEGTWPARSGEFFRTRREAAMWLWELHCGTRED